VFQTVKSFPVFGLRCCKHFRVPIRATYTSYHPYNLWRRAQFGDPRVTMKQPRGKLKFVPLFSQRTKKSFCVQDEGRTVPRIRLLSDWAELCAASCTGRCIPGQKVRWLWQPAWGAWREGKFELFRLLRVKWTRLHWTLLFMKFTTAFNLVKPSDQFNIQQFYVLPTQFIYVFCMDLRTNSDYFPIQR
jgi:hypothetical protein